MKKSLIPPGSFDANKIAKILIAKNDHFKLSFIKINPKIKNVSISAPK